MATDPGEDAFALRRAAPTGPPGGTPAASPGGPATGPAGGPAAGPVALSWHVHRGLTAMKIVGALVFAGTALVFWDDRGRLAIGLAVAVGLAVAAVRDLVAPVRLAADGTGVTVVTGFVSRHHLPWADIERIRLDERRRLGVRAQLVEVDVGETLYLFSTYQLSAPCEDVVDELRRLRTGR
jgi:hypothetical protein